MRPLPNGNSQRPLAKATPEARIPFPDRAARRQSPAHALAGDRFEGDTNILPCVEVFLTLDVNDPERMIDFWSAMLDYALEAEERFDAPEQVYWSLVDRAGVGPHIVIQRVPEPVSAKARLHLDIRVPDMESEADRAVSLGAQRIDVTPLTEVGTTWIRLTDPEGNVFCIVAQA